MAQIERAYLPSRFGQLHYRIARASDADADGDTGPPLLCLHQTPTNGADWLPVMPSLSNRRTVIAIDTPGYGMSDPPPAPPTIEELAEVMAQAMADLAAGGTITPGRFDVMGYHTGSVIATHMANAHPDAVRRLVLFGLAVIPQQESEATLAHLLEAFPKPGRDLTHIERLWANLQALTDPRISWEDCHVTMGECLRLGSRMPWGYIAVFRYPLTAAMARVGQPVLVMNPQDDLWELTLANAHLFPNGRRVDLPGARHGVLKLETTRVVAEIEGFLS